MLIDREKERELCRRILNGDRSAPRELAEHYRECNHSLGKTLLKSINADGDLEMIRQHALTTLGLPATLK